MSASVPRGGSGSVLGSISRRHTTNHIENTYLYYPLDPSDNSVPPQICVSNQNSPTMAQLDLLQPVCPPDFNIAENAATVFTSIHDTSLLSPYPTPAFAAGHNGSQRPIPLITPPATDTGSDCGLDDSDEVIFQSLPPVRSGYPAEHIRNGIVRAWGRAELHATDAEKAFFVADLSQVFRQHERWQACLPGIHPFYGEKFSSSVKLQLTRIHSCQMQPRPLCSETACSPWNWV